MVKLDVFYLKYACKAPETVTVSDGADNLEGGTSGRVQATQPGAVADRQRIWDSENIQFHLEG